MSVCDEGWEAIKLTGCPMAWYDSGGEAVGGCDFNADPDSCSFAAVLRALPGASELAVKYATEMLQANPKVDPCPTCHGKGRV